MSTCGEILANIQLIVPQPEKEALIRDKMNQAIRLISTSGLFWRDIVESTLGSTEGVDAAAYVQSIPTGIDVRKLIYCKYPDPATMGAIGLTNLEDLVDNCDALGDVAYLAGTALHIKNSRLSATFDVAYYTNPDFFATDGTDDDEVNWITELAPGLVEDYTSAYMLNLIGEKEDSNRMTQLATMMQGTYIRDFVMSIIN